MKTLTHILIDNSFLLFINVLCFCNHNNGVKISRTCI